MAFGCAWWRLYLMLAVMGMGGACCAAAAPIPIGSRLELFVDNYLIERLAGGATLRLHPPAPQEIAIEHTAPWEGNSCGYHVVFRDGDVYRMYYKGCEQTLKGEPEPHELVACYAESADGLTWHKPNLGLFEFNGSKDNNIVWMGDGAHDFSPYKDPNPACLPEARYKNVGQGEGGLFAFQSADGIHWSLMQKDPVITQGAFDSQNVAFWDEVRKEYRVYFRDFREGHRDIRTATSPDFVHWSEAVWLEYPGAPPEELYTNGIVPYYRAPHIFVGFPTRYLDRGWSESMRALPELEHRQLRSETSAREGTALTDGLFMSSRDGVMFHRWDRAFIAPGLRMQGNWVYGDNYQNWGIVETKSPIAGAPDEISVYATENYWRKPGSRLRRYSLRIDGFASVEAPLGGGEVVTKPLVFEGKQLVVNFSTSAAGSLRFEIQDEAGTPIPGYTLEEAPEVFGDALDRVVPWKGGGDLAALSGKAVRLRIVMREADLYALQFRP